MKYGDHCYYFSVKEMNWTSSREFCIAQNSSLLVLTDKEMADNLLFKDFFNEHFYWIGLRNNSGWKWEDGTIPNNLRIVSNSLVQKCGTIKKGDLLQASSCEVNLRWVCRRLLSVR
ncbi:killer cell lectin-like receptor subfamily G member 1 isoform X2 [Talpa occidentalis]|nr:killer cell lectin-like receptor subfamily G member 1 isoform X2 [Talpa occidentalis]